MDTFDILLKTSITALRLLVYLTVFKQIRSDRIEIVHSNYQISRVEELGVENFKTHKVIRKGGSRRLWWGSKKASVLLVAKTMERDAKE